MNQQQIGHIVARGHKPHPDRGTYTHSIYSQEVSGLSPDHEITQNGEPVKVPLLGRTLRVKDILPERLALGVDESGEILHQNDFHERYIDYLRGFPSNRDPMKEPVPNVKNFLLKQLDPARPPENGRAFYVDLGFDASRDTEAKQTGEWHPDGVSMDDWRKKNPELAAEIFGKNVNERDAKAAILFQMNADGDISDAVFKKRLAELYEDKKESAKVSEPVDEPVAAKAEAAPAEQETAPCGKSVRAGFIKQHKNFCKKPECAKSDEGVGA